MIDFKPILASKTVLTNIVIGVIGIAAAAGILPASCDATSVANGLGTTVPTLLGTVLTVLAGLSTFFRVKATATLV